MSCIRHDRKWCNYANCSGALQGNCVEKHKFRCCAAGFFVWSECVSVVEYFVTSLVSVDPTGFCLCFSRSSDFSHNRMSVQLCKTACAMVVRMLHFLSVMRCACPVVRHHLAQANTNRGWFYCLSLTRTAPCLQKCRTSFSVGRGWRPVR